MKVPSLLISLIFDLKYNTLAYIPVESVTKERMHELQQSINIFQDGKYAWFSPHILDLVGIDICAILHLQIFFCRTDAMQNKLECFSYFVMVMVICMKKCMYSCGFAGKYQTWLKLVGSYMCAILHAQKHFLTDAMKNKLECLVIFCYGHGNIHEKVYAQLWLCRQILDLVGTSSQLQVQQFTYHQHKKFIASSIGTKEHPL